jgi:uncharacterized membrane protein HdeD (DUF308 family)
MAMKDSFERLRNWVRSLNPRLRLLIGILCIALGLLALVTPLTPGSWLVFVGLEFIGIRLAIWHKLVDWRRGKKRDASDSELL